MPRFQMNETKIFDANQVQLAETISTAIGLVTAAVGDWKITMPGGAVYVMKNADMVDNFVQLPRWEAPAP